jgi:hypothetical protein
MTTASDTITRPQPLVRDDIRARLEPEQVSWLERRLERSQADAAFAYRVSTALFGNRFYIALLAGREMRSAKRIQQEGLKRSFGSVAFEIAIMCLAATFMVCTLLGFGFGLFWLLDQAFGITNLPDYLDKLFH